MAEPNDVKPDPALESPTSSAGAPSAPGDNAAPPAESGEESLYDKIAKIGEEGKEEPPAPEPKPEAAEAAPEELTDKKPEETKEGTPEEKPVGTDEEGEKNGKPIPYSRFQEVIKEKNEYKQRVEELEAQRPLVETAQKINTFCRNNKISNLDLNTALELAALSHTNPIEFAAKCHAMADGIEIQHGRKIPADLQKRVDDGTLSIEDAKEITMGRATRVTAKMSEAALQEQAEAARQEAREAQVASISTALDTWEQAMVAKDPDFKPGGAMHETFVDKLENLCRANWPTSIKAALKLADEAYTIAVKRASALRPKPPVRQTPQKRTPSKQPANLVIDDISDIGKVVDAVMAKYD